ncbi:alpha/beta hydrolase [Allonocardiopsis opalescens]|uniref:Pimeloyl-ACP methyl ester carboxylesterase n=1 Tax=Allonocardiopsis opalescens TaxID=1144618 RepID=A0A2T0Q4L8_9ACTN|nr:alpha/beta hydrolase [Allonocardiopsis opalescens]PRX98755.1 pimeloyl-ACP methyl ester carboxylesterase [Allonocardiopsis opalescens]
MAAPATFVLVPGAWLGAWAWREVAAELRAAGHTVYPLSLTGLGERAAEAGPGADLETHIADITGLLEKEDLREAVLVGHSYGAFPVTGAADRAHERLSHVVYLDAAPAPDGMRVVDLFDPDTAAAMEATAAANGGTLPMPSWEQVGKDSSLTGLGEAERAAIRREAVPHPYASYLQPLRLSHAEPPGVRRGLVVCDDVRQLLAADIPMLAHLKGPEWPRRDIDTGHWPMFSRPAETAAALADLAAS